MPPNSGSTATSERLASELCALYPALAELPQALRDDAIHTQMQAVQVPAGTVLFDEQAPCGGFPFVIEGEVRVARGSPQGRSLELYRVTAGELCVVSASCLFGQHLLTAHGQATLPTRAAGAVTGRLRPLDRA